MRQVKVKKLECKGIQTGIWRYDDKGVSADVYAHCCIFTVAHGTVGGIEATKSWYGYI